MARPRITDHALVRFLDHNGCNTEVLRAQLEISLSRAYAAARALSHENYLIKAGGLVFVVRGDTVTNVHQDDGNVGRRADSMRPMEREA